MADSSTVSGCQVAIIGGGPAGCACAIALAQAGVSDTVVIEAGDYSDFRIGESIPPDILRLLQSLNIDQDFLREKHIPYYGTRSYWGDDRPGYNDTVMNPFGNGWHLDRCRFDKFLAEQVYARGINLWMNTQFIASKPNNHGYTLLLGSRTSKNKITHQLHANFVVDATGRRACFARQQGSRQQHHLPLVVMAARFSVQEKTSTQSGLTHIDAIEQGWWYGAHLPDKHFLLAFYTDAAIVKTRGLKQSENWMSLLASAPNSAHLLPAKNPVKVMGFSAPSYCLDQVTGERWLAIGDAASCWDPITSQGIVKAMANGISAARLIAGAQGLQQFSFHLQQTHQQYLAMRAQFYRMEQRWPGSPFWKSHHGQS